jgi:hypothetical protein
MKIVRPQICMLVVLVLSASSSIHALDKAHPDSYSGHGQARDQWLIKGTDKVANCGGPVSNQTNPQTGATSTSCRVDGMVREIEKAPPKSPKGKTGK